LENDTGEDGTDKITNDGRLAITGVASNTVVEYSIDGGQSWSRTVPTWNEGLNAVEVRQIRVAPSTGFIFTLDTAEPSVLTVTLANDTGTPGDGITSDGTLNVVGKSGVLVEFSIDNGATWHADINLEDGAYTVVARQTDAAGNISEPSTPLSFTLDRSSLNGTTSPNAPLIAQVDQQTVNGTNDSDELSDGGYADVTLNGGDGNDLFHISSEDTTVHGGSGFDQLLVTGQNLGLDLGKVTGVEKIDLGEGGSNTLDISLQDVLNLLDVTPKTLMVTGDASNTVKLLAADGFTHAAGDVEVHHDGVIFDVYHAGVGMDIATLLLEQSIQAQQIT
jgi:hypothetical protein